MADHVSIRELRQNLSVYLRRIERGATLRVTRRGEEVALLSPLPERRSTAERLAAEHGATVPQGDLLDHGPPLPTAADEPALSELVAEQRDELAARG